jgi:hypothetical protein
MNIYSRLTCFPTPWSRVISEKLSGFQLFKKFPAFYGTLMFFTALTSACHLSLSCASSIQPIPPHHTFWISIPKLVPIFRCLFHTNVSVQVRDKSSCLVTRLFLMVRRCQHLAQPKAGRPPLTGCPRLLILYIGSCPQYRGPFLHSQTENAPCLLY